jgi:hypothetical protein
MLRGVADAGVLVSAHRHHPAHGHEGRVGPDA